MADNVWWVCEARRSFGERSEPHTRLLYDPNEVRVRSEATKRSTPKLLLTISIPFPFVHINILGGAPGAMARRRNQPFMMPIALKAATFLAMPASSQLATTSSGFL